MFRDIFNILNGIQRREERLLNQEAITNINNYISRIKMISQRQFTDALTFVRTYKDALECTE